MVKHKHHGLEMGCTSGDHERGLLAPSCNCLEIPNDEEEVNTREIHKCDGQAHDPDTMPVIRSATEHTRCLAMRRAREEVTFDTARSRSQAAVRGVCTPVGKKRRVLCVSDTCADGARVYYAFIQ